MELDEFEKQLLIYSEISAVPTENLNESIPETIQEYRSKMQANSATSIFDQDYNIDRTISQDDSCKKYDEFSIDENITYVVSGRGRGGRNYFHRPGQANTFIKDEDDDVRVREQIRKLHGIGYGNEITESSIKAHQMSKMFNKQEHSNPSDTSTISSVPGNRQISSPDYSADSECSETAEPRKEPFSEKNIFDDAMENGKNKPVKKESKPLPLSVMLKQSREEYKNKVRKKRENKLKEERDNENNLVESGDSEMSSTHLDLHSFKSSKALNKNGSLLVKDLPEFLCYDINDNTNGVGLTNISHKHKHISNGGSKKVKHSYNPVSYALCSEQGESFDITSCDDFPALK